MYLVGGNVGAVCAHLNSFYGVSMNSSYNAVNHDDESGAKRIDCGKRSVKRGDLIGYVGETGNTYGAHLHFEFYDNAKFTPSLYSKLSGTRLEPNNYFNK